MNQALIFYPMFALFGLTGIVLGSVGLGRFFAAAQRKVNPKFYKVFKGEEPDYLTARSRHVANLFEAPTIFYFLCVIAYVTQTVTPLILNIAIGYVVIRYVHALIHLTYNHVLHRLFVFVTSMTVLTVMAVLVFLELPL